MPSACLPTLMPPSLALFYCDTKIKLPTTIVQTLIIFISGPFYFAIVNNEKSVDRIPEPMWTALGKFSHLFTNKVPKTNLPEYSIHYSQSHTEYVDDSHDERLCAYLASPSSPLTV